MLTVLFFARIREQLGVDRLEVTLQGNGVTVASFKQQLIDSHGSEWASVLLDKNVVKAVNQQVVDDDYILNDGDEVAFFPPVTGG